MAEEIDRLNSQIEWLAQTCRRFAFADEEHGNVDCPLGHIFANRFCCPEGEKYKELMHHCDFSASCWRKCAEMEAKVR